MSKNIIKGLITIFALFIFMMLAIGSGETKTPEKVEVTQTSLKAGETTKEITKANVTTTEDL